MMKTILRNTLFILFLLVQVVFLKSTSYASNEGQRLQSFAELKNAILEMKGLRDTKQKLSTTPTEKCGLWISFEVKRLLPTFTKEQQDEIRALLEPQVTQKSRVIGHFQFFYDTTGGRVPAMLSDNGDGTFSQIPNSYEQFIDSAGQYFNESWDMEIGVLGYPAPPLGSSNLYPVYIDDYGFSGYYGVTEGIAVYAVDPLEREITKITIDNDFQYIYSPSIGMPGLKVTAAHEFHHALQVGDYGWRSEDGYFYEVTSVWMEDVVYDDVNDYYQYLSNFATQYTQFSRPELSFTSTREGIQYSRIWGKYIEKKFNRDVMKRTWEYLRSYRSMNAIDHALGDVGSSFQQAFAEYCYWNLHTGPGSDTVNYYSEGRHYPTMRMRPMVEYMNTPRTIQDTLETTSALYFPVCSRQSSSDTCGSAVNMKITVVNTKLDYVISQKPFQYLINSSGGGGFKALDNGLYVNLDVSDPANWTTFESVPSVVSEVVPFPNPFIARGANQLNFRLPSAIRDKATLHVYASSMDKIYEGECPVGYRRPLEASIAWNCRTNTGEEVSSGIYFFVIEIDGNQYQGKFAVVRE